MDSLNFQSIALSFFSKICSSFTSLLFLSLLTSSIIIPTIVTQSSFGQLPAQREKIVLTSVFVQLHTNREMAKSLLINALAKLRIMYPNFDIQLKYLEYPSNLLQSQLLKILNGTTTSGSINLISLNQIWLGKFARRDF